MDERGREGWPYLDVSVMEQVRGDRQIIPSTHFVSGSYQGPWKSFKRGEKKRGDTVLALGKHKRVLLKTH